MKILVTGGTGLIGRAVVAELLRSGHSVRLLSRGAADDAAEFPAQVEPFAADIAADEQLRAAPRGCDAVVHIAGILHEEPPGKTYEKINVGGTRHLLESAARAGAPLFIHVSSLGVDRGQSAYHASKRRAEEFVRAYPGPWLILRPGNIYGPGDETISLLLKMVRTLPAIPLVGDGRQRFQPLWVDDFARVVGLALDRRELAGKTIELAGRDITDTHDVLDRLERLTDRSPARLAVPTPVAQAGAALAESPTGHKVLDSAGLTAPLNSAKLQLLIEENLLSDPTRNAIVDQFGFEPLSLDDGLALLADAMPEQTLAEGVGALVESRYWADIAASQHTAESLLDFFRTHIADVMPIEFTAEPGAPASAEDGATMTGAIPGRGHFQVRLEEHTPRQLTFVTVEGHPLAGVLTFSAQPISADIRFAVRVVSRPSNALDWLALRTFGQFMQSQNWRRVVQRVIDLSGGVAPAGVQRSAKKLNEAASRDLEAWAESIVQRHKRHVLEREIRSAHP